MATLKHVWAWWKLCEQHLKYCQDEDCDLYRYFVNFKKKRGIA